MRTVVCTDVAADVVPVVGMVVGVFIAVIVGAGDTTGAVVAVVVTVVAAAEPAVLADSTGITIAARMIVTITSTVRMVYIDLVIMELWFCPFFPA